MDKTLSDIQTEIRRQLAPIYPSREVQQIIFILLEQFGVSQVQAIAYPDAKISQTDYEQLQLQLKRLTNGEPIQYVIGYEWFMELRFIVNTDVLIPRPETAELVQLIVNQNNTNSPKILDIGTGSGCIAIALKKMIENAEVTAIDISEKAIKVAQENADINDTNVNFLCKSIFADNLHFAPATFDIIVSNPPYITESEKSQMRANVLDFEPHNALFVPDDNPLLFYKQIAEYAQIWLKNGGKLYFEINEQFGNKTTQILDNLSFSNIEIHKDFYQKDRMISAVWNAK